MGEETDTLSGTFKFRVWVTRGCYFVLCDRLRRKARYSIGSVTLLSFYVFVLSLLQIFPNLSLASAHKDILSVLTLTLSVFIIIITLLESSKNYAIDAEFSLMTAQELATLFGRCELVEAGLSKEEAAELHREYDLILNRARTTRRAIDYLWFQFDNYRTFEASPGRMVVLVLGLMWNGLLEYWLYAAMAVGPPVGAAYLLL